MLKNSEKAASADKQVAEPIYTRALSDDQLAGVTGGDAPPNSYWSDEERRKWQQTVLQAEQGFFTNDQGRG